MFTIIYTSGTTGVPKGVVLTHDNLIAGVCSAIRAMQIVTLDVHYLFLPLAHVLGARARVGHDPDRLRDGVLARDRADQGGSRRVRPTFMAGVPRIFEKFYAGVKAALEQGSGLKRKLAAWALARGRGARGGACAPASPAGGLSYWLADKLVLSKLRARLGLDRAAS